LVAEFGPEADDLCGIAPSSLQLSRVPSQGRPSPHRRAIGDPAGFSRGGVRMKLSILMAAYNEAETITQAIDEVLEINYPCEIELIIVDDGSNDETPNLLAQVDDPRVTMLRHPNNRGKGAALLTAVGTATGTHILPFDADLEYVAEDILKLVEPVLRGRCSVVYGVRLFGYYTVYGSYLYAIGNKIFTRTANMLFGACLSDLHTCLKLIPIDVLKSLDLREDGFGLDTEVSASLLRGGIRPFEVPVSYFSRSHEQGKKINWRDALACLRILLRVRVQSRSRFARAREFAGIERHKRPSTVPEPSEAWEGPALRVNEPTDELGVGATG
jgi:dolichol-phosphate hexosyltransferase